MRKKPFWMCSRIQWKCTYVSLKALSFYLYPEWYITLTSKIPNDFLYKFLFANCMTSGMNYSHSSQNHSLHFTSPEKCILSLVLPTKSKPSQRFVNLPSTSLSITNTDKSLNFYIEYKENGGKHGPPVHYAIFYLVFNFKVVMHLFLHLDYDGRMHRFKLVRKTIFLTLAINSFWSAASSDNKYIKLYALVWGWKQHALFSNIKYTFCIVDIEWDVYSNI